MSQVLDAWERRKETNWEASLIETGSSGQAAENAARIGIERQCNWKIYDASIV